MIQTDNLQKTYIQLHSAVATENTASKIACKFVTISISCARRAEGQEMPRKQL